MHGPLGEGLKLVGDFWTSGTDNGCDNKFWWCSKNVKFKDNDVKWKSGEPSANGDCVYLQNRNTTDETYLVTDDCSKPKKFFCEVYIIYLIYMVANI